jgi:hypothetical protein
MKSPSPIRVWISTAVLSGLILSLGAFAFRANASVWDKKTVITVNQPMQVQDTYLEPGSYVFKLLDSASDRHIVQIFDRDEDHLINTILAIPNYRLQPTGDSRFLFYETPPGYASAVRAWFYPGDNFGQEFRYPKQLRQLAVAVAPSSLSVPPEPPPPPIITQPAEPEVTPPSQAESPRQEEPAVVAQNNPPPPPPRPEIAPPSVAPNPVPVPKELPKTATLFPLIGLCGGLSLFVYSLLRIKSMT